MENSRQKLHRLHDIQPHPPSRNTSFSSSLLDAIDQSIIKSGGGSAQPPPLRCATRIPAIEKQRTDQRTSSRIPAYSLQEDRRFLSIISEKPTHEKRSLQQNLMRERDRLSVVNSSSSSSESSYGGFSSSEAESTHPQTRQKTKSPKICGETKNFKTPVSPGGRIAGFINSLFSPSAQSKKAKIASKPENVVRKGDESGFSSASSFSRSCISKPVPKRSVRFLDEDPLYLPRLTAIKVRQETPEQRGSDLAAAVEEERNRFEKARKLISSYEERKRGFAIAVVEEQDEDDDDAASYCSSDLFELKDLSAIDVGRDELPVYETTSFSCGIVV